MTPLVKPSGIGLSCTNKRFRAVKEGLNSIGLSAATPFLTESEHRDQLRMDGGWGSENRHKDEAKWKCDDALVGGGDDA